MLSVNTNRDGIVDFVSGKVVVLTNWTAAENAAAADIGGAIGIFIDWSDAPAGDSSK